MANYGICTLLKSGLPIKANVVALISSLATVLTESTLSLKVGSAVAPPCIPTLSTSIQPMAKLTVSVLIIPMVSVLMALLCLLTAMLSPLANLVCLLSMAIPALFSNPTTNIKAISLAATSIWLLLITTSFPVGIASCLLITPIPPFRSGP